MTLVRQTMFPPTLKDHALIDSIDRDQGYWTKLEHIAKEVTEQQDRELRRVLNISGTTEIIRLNIVSDDAMISPSIRLLSVLTFELSIPTGYFKWIDNAAEWMNHDLVYREMIYLGRLARNADHSKFFHSIWLNWLIHHEVGHAICGHLSFLNSHQFIEFEALSPRNARPRNLDIYSHQALETDADVWAAQMFFAA